VSQEGVREGVGKRHVAGIRGLISGFKKKGVQNRRVEGPTKEFHGKWARWLGKGKTDRRAGKQNIARQTQFRAGRKNQIWGCAERDVTIRPRGETIENERDRSEGLPKKEISGPARKKKVLKGN